MVLPGGQLFYIGLHKGKHDKFFLSITTRTKALILSMQHHLVDHYQICSKKGPLGQMGLPEVTEAYLTGAHRTGEQFRASLALLFKSRRGKK